MHERLRQRIRRLRRLNAREWVLLMVSLCLVLLVRLGLWFLPFRMVRWALGQLPHVRHGGPDGIEPEKVAWAIRAAAHFVPCATCLTQALAAQAILSFINIPTTLRIGVAPGGTRGCLKAHAWLECRDRVIIGGETSRHFIPFPPIGGDLP